MLYLGPNYPRKVGQIAIYYFVTPLTMGQNWNFLGIFLKILNFDFCQFPEPLNSGLHGVIEYGPWAFQEY
jgi:hypothetical protein